MKIKNLITLVKQSFETIPTDMENEEMCRIVDEVTKKDPKIIVELGVKNGGSLNVWRKIIPEDGFIIAIDSNNDIKFDINQYKNMKFIKGNSLHYKTYNDFLITLNGRNIEKIDVLFIDAGHAYVETKSDFYTFAWHVKKGGLVVFHDINLNSEGDVIGSTKHLWQEIKNRSGKYWKVVSEIQLHTGTGIIEIL